MVRKTDGQAGDTLVEVLMAIVIISVVIVGAITMMNRGLAIAQVALEHSQARLSINGQIEMLRFVRDQYVANKTDPNAVTWGAIVAASDQQPINYTSACTVSSGKQPFYLSKAGAQVTRSVYTGLAPPAAATPGSGMWIEALTSAPGISPAYLDIVIRGCWQGSGSAGEQRVVTAVRLYDPSR